MQETPPPTKFTAEMPHIPGVGDPSAKPAGSQGKPILLSIALGAVLLVVGSIFWWAAHSVGRRTQQTPEAAQALPAEPLDLAPTSVPATSGPVTAATVSELAKPWSAKEFTFVDLVTHNSIPAVVVRLPGAAAASSSSAYWAFSLQAPYENCQLEYVADLNELETRFGYHAVHPMVASSCNGAIYDPLKMGTIPTGAWVRGEIVQGAGIRPPTSIEIKVQGNNLVADQIE